MTLAELGEALYGPNWKGPVALALFVNLRTVQRWAAEDAAPAWVIAELEDRWQLRQERITALLREDDP